MTCFTTFLRHPLLALDGCVSLWRSGQKMTTIRCQKTNRIRVGFLKNSVVLHYWWLKQRRFALKTAMSVTVASICVLWTSFSYSQNVCDEAIAHITDCQTVFCAMTGDDDCLSAFDGLGNELEPCSNEIAVEVLNSTCARLVGDGTGDVCEQAAQWYLSCLEQTCLTTPDSPFCGADIMDAIREAYAGAAEMECDFEFEAQAEMVLESTCDELFPSY